MCVCICHVCVWVIEYNCTEPKIFVFYLSLYYSSLTIAISVFLPNTASLSHSISFLCLVLLAFNLLFFHFSLFSYSHIHTLFSACKAFPSLYWWLICQNQQIQTPIILRVCERCLQCRMLFISISSGIRLQKQQQQQQQKVGRHSKVKSRAIVYINWQPNRINVLNRFEFNYFLLCVRSNNKINNTLQVFGNLFK